MVDCSSLGLLPCSVLHLPSGFDRGPPAQMRLASVSAMRLNKQVLVTLCPLLFRLHSDAGVAVVLVYHVCLVAASLGTQQVAEHRSGFPMKFDAFCYFCVCACHNRLQSDFRSVLTRTSSALLSSAIGFLSTASLKVSAQYVRSHPAC